MGPKRVVIQEIAEVMKQESAANAGDDSSTDIWEQYNN